MSAVSATILLVDDNPDIFMMYRDVLPQMSPYTILTAEDGVKALEVIEAQQTDGHALPSCIVIDVMMPHLDGLQLVRALRGDPATEPIPLVILTALAQDKDHYIGLASGADQYLVKPVSVPDLLTAIAQAISQSAVTRAQRMQTMADEPDAHA